MDSLNSRWLAQTQRSIDFQFPAPVKGFPEKSVPLPHEEFESYFSSYTDYDSVVGAPPASVPELNIAGGPYQTGESSYSSVGHPQMSMADVSQLTVKPSALARYSKMMNYNNVAATAAAVADSQFPHHPLTPAVSPMKSHLATSEVFLQPQTSPVSLPLSSPSLAYSAQLAHSSSLYSKDTPFLDPNSSPVPQQRRRSVFGESDSDTYFSSSEHSPNIDASPELQSGHQFFSGATPGLASMNVFSSVDMGPIDSTAGIAWQPVITAPKNDDSEEIIRIQQQTGKQSNRKSCLPPGRVDAYMAGPNDEGLFECLFPNCGKFFRRRYNVRSHIQTHLSDRPYACDSCGACFVRPHDLRRHEKCHQEERPYSCPCGKGFTRHDALQRHRLRMICSGGIELPGKPRKIPGKRGRPRKARSMVSLRSSANVESPSDDNSSPYSDQELEFVKEEGNDAFFKDEVLWSRQ